MSIVILDNTVDSRGIEDAEDMLYKAFEERIPSLIGMYGLEALQNAGYRLRLEVILDDAE